MSRHNKYTWTIARLGWYLMLVAALVLPMVAGVIAPQLAVADSLPPLVINEFMANPTTGTEWIELYNPTAGQVNLAGWTIEDNTGSTYGSGAGNTSLTGKTIAPGGYLLLTKGTDFSFVLNNDNDVIIIKNGTAQVDKVAYGNWNDGNTTDNAPAPAQGKSTGRCPNGWDTNADNVDFIVLDIPTPNAANSCPTYTLTMAVTGNGSTTPSVGAHDYPQGTSVSITANAAQGWQFVNWTGDVANPNVASTAVTMGANKTVTANFTITVISNPVFSLNPSSGSRGTTVTISGSGFTPSTAGTIWFDTNGNNSFDTGEPQASVTTTASGAIPAGVTITVPAAGAGAYSVRADIAIGGPVEASATFTVPALAVALSPSTGISGTVITVSGSGFTPNAAGMVWFDSNGNNAVDAGEPQTSVTTTASGAIPAGVNLTVPAANTGTYSVRADIAIGGPVEASGTFAIPILAITSSPTSGAPGTVITITGSGFNPGTAGTIWFDTNGNNAVDAGEPQISVITSSNGSTPAGVNLTVPSLAVYNRVGHLKVPIRDSSIELQGRCSDD